MSKMSRAAGLLKTAASTMGSGVKGAAANAGATFKAGAAASQAKGASIVADKAMDGLKKEAARATAKTVTGDAFKKGIKSGFKAGGESTSKSVTGETLKRAAGRLTDSDYVNSAIKPGLSSAFEQAGGRAGMARRIVGGAAAGGVTTGTIGALQGRDFWEDAKGGAWRGGLAGGGRQIYKMGKTEVGSELMSSVRGEMSSARAGASAAQGRRDAEATLGPGSKDFDGDIGSMLSERNAKKYMENSFAGNAISDIRAAASSRQEVFKDAMSKAEARGNQEYESMKARTQKRKASSSDIPTRKESAPKSNVSNPVRVLKRANRHANMSNSMLGNHQGGRGRRGVRPRMR